MSRSDYISVLMLQTIIDVRVSPTSELANFDSNWYHQYVHSCELICKHKPDIVVYPETFYNPAYESDFIELSKGRLIVAGSTYNGTQNETVVFYFGEEYRIPKANPSPLEVASKYMNFQNFDSLVNDGDLYKDIRTFRVHEKDVTILNCMEYYNSAYFMARYGKYNKDLFGFIVPCSSNNIQLFSDETIALNNHKEGIYTFLCNRISPRGESTTKGGSYVYGPVNRLQKSLLKQEYPCCNLSHSCGIVRLEGAAQYVYGEYAINTSAWGRSDDYRSTPLNFIVGDLRH